MTRYHDELTDELVKDGGGIAKHYLKSWRRMIFTRQAWIVVYNTQLYDAVQYCIQCHTSS